MLYSAILLVSIVTAVQAANDWSQPCLSGVCSYDLPASAGPASGTLKIWGSKDAISDITTAAGWEVLDCTPDVLEQDIRLVCTSGNSNDAGCAHLYEGPGAEGKIVRLPEACGKNAFARVAKAWVPADQSIPAGLVKQLARRDGTMPQVKALHLDTNFAAADPSKAGAVNFAIRAATVPGANGDIDTSTIGSQRRSRIYGNRSFGDVIGSLFEFNFNESKALNPVDIDQKSNLFKKEISCPPLSASLNVDVDINAHAIAIIGVVASGTILPPKVKEFGIRSSLTADINGSLNFAGTISGTLDSGKIPIFEIGIPGLDFPEVLTIGPTFEVNAQVVANLDLGLDLTVGLNHKINNAELIFPPSSDKSQAAGGSFNIGDTPLKLSASPSIKATGTVEAHLIPSLNLKVSALGIGDAGIFLQLDASAKIDLSLEAQAQGNLNIARANNRANIIATKKRGHPSETVPAPGLTSVITKNSVHITPPQHMRQGQQIPPPSVKKLIGRISLAGDNRNSQNSTAGISTVPLTATSTVSVDANATEFVSTTKLNNVTKSVEISTVSPTAVSTASVDAQATESASTTELENVTTSVEISTVPPTATSTASVDASATESTSTTEVGNVTTSVGISGTTSGELEIGSTGGLATSTTDSTALPHATDDGTGGVGTTPDINGSFGGCVDIGAGLNVNAGADADFLGLFNPSTKVNLFSKNFQLFKKCFGSANTKRSFPRSPRHTHSVQPEARELACPAADVGAAASIVDVIVSAASIATL